VHSQRAEISSLFLRSLGHAVRRAAAHEWPMKRRSRRIQRATLSDIARRPERGPFALTLFSHATFSASLQETNFDFVSSIISLRIADSLASCKCGADLYAQNSDVIECDRSRGRYARARLSRRHLACC